MTESAPAAPAGTAPGATAGATPGATVGTPAAPPGTAPGATAATPPAEPATAEPAASDTPAPAPTRTPKRRDKRAKGDPGILVVQASPWAWVTVGNERKETPERFHLPPGNYVVKFYNPELGVTKYENVTIQSGKLERLDEVMDR